MIFTFADIEINTDRYELRRSEKLVSIEPLIFNLIVFLIHHADQLFSRDELIAAVWQGRIVSDATVSSAIKSARKALGDDGKKQRYIKTIHGRGFKFIGNIHINDKPNVKASSKHQENKAQTKQPSVIVLAFTTLSEKSNIQQLSNGLQANIETILTRVPLLNVSSQSAEFNPQANAVSAREIHEQLDIDYVIDGIIQIIEKRFSVNINLTQAKSGFRLWSERFEHTINANNPALDTLVIKILSKLEPQLNRAIFKDIHSDSVKPDSQQLYLQASTLLATRGWHRDSFLEAARLLEQSRNINPDFALAPAYLSLVLALGHRVGLLSKTNKVKTKAIAAADNAIELDNMDSTVLGFSGCALADVGLLTRAFSVLKNAIEINSANAQAWTALGSAYLLNSETQLAIDHLTHGIKISPLDTRLSIWQAVLALAYMQAKNSVMAKENAELACQRDDKTYFPRIVLAAIHITRKNSAQATLALNDAYRVKPDLSQREVEGVVGKKLARLLL